MMTQADRAENGAAIREDTPARIGQTRFEKLPGNFTAIPGNFQPTSRDGVCFAWLAPARRDLNFRTYK